MKLTTKLLKQLSGKQYVTSDDISKAILKVWDFEGEKKYKVCEENKSIFFSGFALYIEKDFDSREIFVGNIFCMVLMFETTQNSSFEIKKFMFENRGSFKKYLEQEIK